MRGDREPEPEVYSDSQDFYDSLMAEMNYTPSQKNLIEYSRSLLGAPYTYGMQDPEQGFDCSGFVQYSFNKSLGVHLPRSAAQMAATGEMENIDQLQAGDLVFFNTLGYQYSHVGIYIGNGRFIHASTNKKAIVIGNLKNEYFAKRYTGARRVLS